MTARGGSRWTDADVERGADALAYYYDEDPADDMHLCAVREVLHAVFPVGEPDDERLKPSTLEEATGGKPFGECSREELLEACRWFWMARDEARAELAAVRAAGRNDG